MAENNQRYVLAKPQRPRRFRQGIVSARIVRISRFVCGRSRSIMCNRTVLHNDETVQHNGGTESFELSLHHSHTGQMAMQKGRFRELKPTLLRCEMDRFASPNRPNWKLHECQCVTKTIFVALRFEIILRFRASDYTSPSRCFLSSLSSSRTSVRLSMTCWLLSAPARLTWSILRAAAILKPRTFTRL